MKTERAMLIAKLMMVVGFGSAILILIGELRGWWNGFGETALPIATLVGALGGVTGIVIGSSSQEVQVVGAKVDSVGYEVQAVPAAVEDNGETLDSVDDKLDKLDVVEEALVTEDEDRRVSKLDLVQTELGRQTGVLDRQVSILQEIRDGL